MAIASETITREVLVDRGFLKETHPVNLDDTMPLSDFKTFSPEEKKEFLGNGGIVVIDNAIWATTDMPAGSQNFDEATFVSSDGKIAAKHIRRNKLGVYKVGLEGLALDQYIHLNTDFNNPEEEDQMADELNTLESLRSQVQQVNTEAGGAGAAGTTVNNMQSFNGNPPAEAAATGNQRKTSPFVTNMRERLANVGIHHLERLFIFNRSIGSFVAVVTNEEDRIEFRIKQRPVVINGKKQLLANVDDSVRALYDEGKPVKAENFQTTLTVEPDHIAPGKILGVVINMPVAGFVPYESLTDPDLAFDAQNKDTKMMLFGSEMYPTILTAYFKNVIKEDPRTHGDSAAEIVVHTTTTKRRVNKVVTDETVVRRVLKNSNKRSVIIPTNFFPLRLFEKIDVTSGRLNQEQIDLLNMSAFQSVVSARFEDQSPKYNGFDAVTKQAIRIEDGQIVSSYFTLNAEGRLPIKVKPYYDRKGQDLETIQIPTVRHVPASDSTKRDRYPRIVYDVLSKEYLEDQAYAARTSLLSPRFETVRAVAGEALSLENLRSLKQSQGGGSRSETRLSQDDVLRMQLNMDSSALAQVSFGETSNPASLVTRLFKAQMEMTQ